MNFEELKQKVQQWSEARGIYQHSNATSQLLKAVSEMGELADAEAKQRRTEQADAVGDVLVCLINYCYMKDMDIVACLGHAYDEIKDRKGKMIYGGVFVKEEA